MNPNDVVRIYADWLAGTLTDYAAAAQGFEVHRTGVPKDAGDTVPRAVTVLDESRDPELARGEVPEAVASGPLLLVQLSQAIEFDGEVGTNHRDADHLQLAISFASQDIDTEDGLTEAGYALRTIVRSITELHLNENAAKRVRNSTNILAANSISVLTVRNDPEDANKNILGAVVLDLLVRDDDPDY